MKKLLKFLNGRFSLKDIGNRSGISADTVGGICRILSEKGLIVNLPLKSDTERVSCKEVYFSRFGNWSEINAKVENSSVCVVGSGSMAMNVIEEMVSFGLKRIRTNVEAAANKKFRNAGKGHARIEYYDVRDDKKWKYFLSKSQLLLLCEDSHNPALTKNINKICAENGNEWLSCRIVNGMGEIGPTVIPGITSCYLCYVYRSISNAEKLKEYVIYDEYEKRNPEILGHLPVFHKIVAQFTAIEAVKILSKYAEPQSYNSVISIDFEKTEIDKMPVLRVPNCEGCRKYGI
ncbi:MAG: TOMM precursor leader peptide-binding protein [Candidatus Aenigmarchaeota archaeon]|nr:TOMM precursor leader peptide-binding protein [Candidatus Aenigmarchaeota archaeon]